MLSINLPSGRINKIKIFLSSNFSHPQTQYIVIADCTIKGLDELNKRPRLFKQAFIEIFS